MQKGVLQRMQPIALGNSFDGGNHAAIGMNGATSPRLIMSTVISVCADGCVPLGSTQKLGKKICVVKCVSIVGTMVVIAARLR